MTGERPHGPLGRLARVLRLAGQDDDDSLAAALAEVARELLGVPAAAVVPAAEADAGAEELRASHGEVAAVPLPGSAPPRTLVLAGTGERPKAGEAAALAELAAAAFAQQAERAAERRRASLQTALATAGRSLQESLDVTTLLTRICREAARVVDADAAVVLRAADEELVVEAVHGRPPEVVGWRMAAGAGLAGRALAEQRALASGTDDAGTSAAAGSPWGDVRASIAVPVDWGGRLRGVLSAAFVHRAAVTEAHVEALEAFADLAGVAFANANLHTGLALTARTDALTGCLNHAALHDGLRREVERAERAQDRVLSLILLDVERPPEAEGPVADEILRRAGHALRSTTRPYDLAARYGGDEFALVCIEADEGQACEIAARAVGRLSAALDDLGHATATAGVAQWTPGMTAGDLVARADRVLIYGRRAARRGEVLTEDDLPPTFAPGRGRRRDRRLPPAPSGVPAWSPAAGDPVEPLRARTRALVRANELGARLAALRSEAAVVAAAEEALREAFGYERAAVVAGDEPEAAGALAVPVDVAGTPWGVVRVEGDEPLGDDDRRLLETVAGHVGAAITAARRQEALRRGYVRAAALVAAGLETGAPAAGGLAGLARAVAQRLGLEGVELRALTLAAVVHETGGGGDEALVVRGDEAPVAGRGDAPAADDAARAGALLHAARERWDGGGPGGLAGEAIPLGARVLAASAAFHAADPTPPASDQLRRAAGTRFDPAVVAAVLAEAAVTGRSPA